jgi:aspartate aminotransferase
MSVSKKIDGMITRSSWIRKMFEEGGRLKAEHGADKVFDFSLGNPNLQPPECFRNILEETVRSCCPGDHGYMPNIGYPHVRSAVAEQVSREQRLPVAGDDVIMTCGAAGALNVILKTILDPGDEIVCCTPFFVEYTFYVDNHGGVLKTVPALPDFLPDLPAIEAAIGPKTKGLLINSPNNPTGRVYPEETLLRLGELLAAKGKALGRTLYLISDEPYRKIVYDGITVPSVFTAYDDCVIASSYSKDISIPGERIGFIAVSPKARYRSELLSGMALANRILGFVNAPALAQRVVACIQGSCVDISDYQRKRDLLCDGLSDAGYEFTKPSGAFYLFPRTPVPDDVAFVRALQEELILTVPGSGFGGPGHFRIAYCVDDRTIMNALPGFRRVRERF